MSGLGDAIREALRKGIWHMAEPTEALDALDALEAENTRLEDSIATLSETNRALQRSAVGNRDGRKRAEAENTRLREALEEVQARQPRTLERLRANGVVFNYAPMPDPDDPDGWQLTAFWIYTDLCEVETIARAALAGGDEP